MAAIGRPEMVHATIGIPTRIWVAVMTEALAKAGWTDHGTTRSTSKLITLNGRRTVRYRLVKADEMSPFQHATTTEHLQDKLRDVGDVSFSRSIPKIQTCKSERMVVEAGRALHTTGKTPSATMRMTGAIDATNWPRLSDYRLSMERLWRENGLS